MSARITHNPDQCGGRPCIRGMRIRVQDILELDAAGQSSEQILADFPYLEPEDLKAVLAYAARENAALHGQTATASLRACPVDGQGFLRAEAGRQGAGAGVGVGLQRHRGATEQLLLSWGSHRGRAAQARCTRCSSASGSCTSRATFGSILSGTRLVPSLCISTIWPRVRAKAALGLLISRSQPGNCKLPCWLNGSAAWMSPAHASTSNASSLSPNRSRTGRRITSSSWPGAW